MIRCSLTLVGVADCNASLAGALAHHHLGGSLILHLQEHIFGVANLNSTALQNENHPSIY